MRRFVLVSSVFAAVAVLLPKGSGAADVAPIRLETLVPSGSLAFGSFEAVGTMGARFRATALGRMLDDPEMKAFVGPIADDLKKLAQDKQSKGGLPIPPMVLELAGKLAGLEGQAAVALVDVGEEKPTFAASLDFGGKLSDFIEFVQRIKDDPSEDKPPVHATVDGQRTWWSIGNPDRPAVFATALGTALFVSNDHGWLERTVNGALAPIDGALSTSAPFQRVRAASGGEALAMSLFANVPAILAKVRMPEDAKRMVDALGLGAVEAAGYGMSFAGDGLLDSIVIDAPKTDHGILTLMPTKAIDHAGLAWAPSNAFYYAEQSTDLAGLVRNLRNLLGRIDPSMASELEDMLGKAREITGMDLEKDVLSGLGEGMSAWLSLPETGGVYPELGLVFNVKDAAAFEATIAKTVDALCREAGKSERVTASRRVIEWHGKRLHVVDLAGVARRTMVPFTPTICFVGNRMLVTLVPHAMKEILLRLEMGTANAGLAGQEDVKSLLAAAPKGHSSFGYLDLQAILNLAYDTGVPLLQTAVKPNLLGGAPVRLDWAQLPAARSMRPYFRSLGAFCVSDGKSMQLSVHSPVGLVVPIAAMAAMGAAFMTRRSAVFEVPGTAVDEIVVSPEQSAEAQAKADLLRGAVVDFYGATGRLPEGLADLTAKNPKTDAPYIAEVPLDPWGFGFVYTVLDAVKGAFEVRSWGADGLPKTSDDVVATIGVGK